MTLRHLALTHADVPKHLYRVQSGSSATLFSSGGGLVAASNFLHDGRLEVQSALLDHLDWHARVPSPFISTFSDANKARSWARRYPGDNVEILTIETARMPGAAVFHATSLCDAVGVAHLVPPKARHSQEYLVLYAIPMCAISSVAPLAADVYAAGVEDTCAAFGRLGLMEIGVCDEGYPHPSEVEWFDDRTWDPNEGELELIDDWYPDDYDDEAPHWSDEEFEEPFCSGDVW